MTRTARRITGFLGIAALLFAQLAVSAHACPRMAALAVPAESHAAMPCEKADPADSNLCLEHCKGSEQAQGSSSSVFVAVAPAYVTPLEPAVVAREITFRADPALFHATSPPPTIRNCCLRI